LRKIIFILGIIIFSTGCSVSRKQSRAKTKTDNNSVNSNLYESIVNQNLTARSFFIDRAEFKIITSEGEKSGLGTIKFLMPDKFLISIKSKTGIEVSRIMLTGDSIRINDKFNKKLFYGSTSFLKNKYGITTALLPVILGDYVNDERIDSSKIFCEEGKLDIEGVVNEVRIEYVMDCILGKSILTVPGDIVRKETLQIRYSDFFKANNIYTPGKIVITEKESNTTIEIKIQKIISPWEGNIEFIPGKQYEKIRLL
jgi:hypothetical protein